MSIERITATDTAPEIRRLELARRRLDADTLEYMAALEAASRLGIATPPERPTRLLTILQAAERLAVSDRTVKSLITSGNLARRKVGGATRIEEHELERYIAECPR